MSQTDQFTRGVLYSRKSEKNYDLTRVKPSEQLSRFVETFWHVSWNMQDQQVHRQENIPDPCINMVFEATNSRIVGAVTKRYSVELADKGMIFGVKFLPGGFYALSKFDKVSLSVSTFSDSSLSIKGVFGPDGEALVDAISAARTVESMVQLSEDFLRSKILNSSDDLEKIDKVLNEISSDSTIMSVESLAQRLGTSVRSLQRLFRNQVGVSPKWAIRKFRIQEVLSKLEDGVYDWQQLIAELGYFDQSHFAKDFRDLVGVTPSEYIKRLSK